MSDQDDVVEPLPTKLQKTESTFEQIQPAELQLKIEQMATDVSKDVVQASSTEDSLVLDSNQQIHLSLDKVVEPFSYDLLFSETSMPLEHNQASPLASSPRPIQSVENSTHQLESQDFLDKLCPLNDGSDDRFLAYPELNEDELQQNSNELKAKEQADEAVFESQTESLTTDSLLRAAQVHENEEVKQVYQIYM